jgi:DNA-binding GntR family transcriptional regulator
VPTGNVINGAMTESRALPLTFKAYHQLKRHIGDLRFRPGEILMVQSLAKELGISRTPVREALVRLQQEGFVEEAEGKKFKVSEITLKSILELHEIRELMEGHSVKQVAAQKTGSQIDELRTLAKRMEQALGVQDPDRFFEADLEFHAKIILFCGNHALQQLSVQLTEKIQRVRFLTLYVHRRLEEKIDEHNKILEGIVAQGPRGAHKALNLHLRKVKKGVEHLFKECSLGFLSRPL